MDLAEMLAEEGYDVVGQAGDGEEAVRLAIEQRPDLVILDVKMPKLAERLETRKLVDRAKSILQTKFGLSEPDSFRWIQKTAMDKRVSMRQVAELVVDEAGS